jgi:predicted AAA+ superfamily ATPase
MIEREISAKIKLMASKMPIISIAGPRQSGKTTLAKMCFPDYKYANLENPDTMEEAMSDPRLFLNNGGKGLIIDEIQNYPKLLSYIQTISDEHNQPGEFIITGSQNLLISEKISQSLAGRVFVTCLLPFSLTELSETDFKMENFEKYIKTGFYPRVYSKKIDPELFYPSYIQTYAERDLRQIVNVSNLFSFKKFMKLAAGRIGQLLNYNSIATELGIDLKTVKSWFSILETSFIVFFLQPHHRNFSKRLIKTPKLYFYDTGLACSLLGIKKESDLKSHWARGALFENMVIADLCKNYFNKAIQPPLYFWRDNTGNEIDCLIDDGANIKCIEIKSSTTISSDFFKGLNFYQKLDETSLAYLVYGGHANTKRKEASVVSWEKSLDLV